MHDEKECTKWEQKDYSPQQDNPLSQREYVIAQLGESREPDQILKMWDFLDDF